MPNAPGKLCNKCHKGIVRDGTCSKCGPIKRTNWSEQRGTQKERGYGWDWRQLRDRKLRASPLCERCEKAGSRKRVVAACEVHHLMPFKSVDDPMRLRWSNLESLCKDCHGKATGGRAR